MSLPWATPGEKGCPCAVLSLTATAQYCVQALCVFLCGGTRLPTLTLPEGFSCGTSTIVHVYPQPHSQCALCSCPRPLCGSVRVATSFPTKTSRKFFGDNSQEERKHLFRMVEPSGKLCRAFLCDQHIL